MTRLTRPVTSLELLGCGSSGPHNGGGNITFVDGPAKWQRFPACWRDASLWDEQ